MLEQLRSKCGFRNLLTVAIVAAVVLPATDACAQQRQRGGRRQTAETGAAVSESTNAPVADARPSEKKHKLVAVNRVMAGFPAPSRIRPVTVSPDGKRVAYEVVRGERHVVIVDGREAGVFARIWNIKFSPDSARVAYVGQRIEDARQSVVLDGREVGVYAEVSPESLAFSPAGDRFGFVARNDGEKPLWFIVIDGTPGKSWEEILPGSPVFSGDGAQVTFAGLSAGRWQVITNGGPGPAWDEIAPRSITCSQSGGRMAYAARSESNWRAVIDGKSEAFGSALADGTPVLSRDGKHVAYGLQRDGHWFIVVDGIEHQGAEKVEHFVFSPDGARHAYVAHRGGKEVLVLDGRDDKEFAEIPGPITFSADGKRLAFVAVKDGKPLVVVDGKESKSHDEILGGPVFGPDNKHVAWLARSGEKWRAVIDSTESADTYDGCKGGLVFRESNRIAFYAINLDAARNDDFLAVEMTLAEE